MMYDSAALKIIQLGFLTHDLDWQLKFEVGRQLEFPDTIAETMLSPDLHPNCGLQD